MPTVLIVDDEPDIRRLVEITLTRMGLDTCAAETLAAAREEFSDAPIDVCLTDMQLPDGNGVELVEWVQEHHPATPIAMITAYGSQEAAISALKAGAFDFVNKPLDIDKLRTLVKTALNLVTQQPDAVQVSTGSDSSARAGTSTQNGSAAAAADAKSPLLGSAPSIQTLRATIAKLARSQAPVYVHGESGTGKELVARMIHDQGARAAAPFVPVNCGAIPAELMESEFFGHKKGSFTGATQDKAGLFVAAEGGTLFLDEVADLPLTMQVKLLRVIQERAVRAVGGEAEVPVDVRIVSATHKDLDALVAAGAFRQDLYYRLNVIGVDVPPLRERQSDIPELADELLRRIAQRHGLAQAPALSEEALNRLCRHTFPGNVRELVNVLERAVTLCDSEFIDAEDLQLRAAPAPGAGRSESPSVADQAGVESDLGTESVGQPVQAADSLREELEELERGRIIDALTATRYNKTKAAELLGMTFRQLRYRLKKLDIE